jgi:beta-glucosidase
VVSDAFAVRNLLAQGFAREGKDAAARALTAGLDMDMASGTFAQHLVALVKQGTLEETQIDAAVRRILSVKLRLGLFEAPYADEARAASVFADPQHRADARRAAQRSMVLLRNEKKLLPLPQSLTNVAVIGALADSERDTEGSWT